MTDYHTERNTWIMGNWKTNPATQQAAIELTEQLCSDFFSQLTDTTDPRQMLIAPSPLHLSAVAAHISDNMRDRLWLMGQDCCAYTGGQGAYTGDVSAAQLADIGARAVLVGHSERRQYHGEANALLIKKMQHALQAGLMAVLCVGENQAQREAQTHFDIVAQQVIEVLQAVKPDTSQLAQVVIAYEPVWAIGTGLSASAEDAQAMHAHIRQTVTQLDDSYAHISIVYGGSVKPANASDLAECADIDGVLVGGASLDAAQFLDIYAAFG